MIVGTGNVGASIAYALINQRTAVREIILTDLNAADAEGEAMDLSDALATTPSFLKIKSGSYQDAKDCDICVITAGANQKPGETRTDLLQKNYQILKSIVTPVMTSGFDGIFLIVSNPMDALTYATWKLSGLPAEHIIGSGTVLDSARLRFQVSQELAIHPKSVHAYQIGEHGDSEFALWSSANVGGEKLTDLIKPNKLNKIEAIVTKKAYEIIDRKGATFYGIGAATVQIINSILNDERRMLCVSSYDDFADTFYGFPTIVGRAGIIQRLSPTLSEAEGIRLQKSINRIKNTTRAIKTWSLHFLLISPSLSVL